MVWRGRRSCEPPLLGHLSHNYASPVVCLDLLWCIRARIYTRDWSPRGYDRNLESPRKSTLDFREAGRDDNDSRATRTKNHGRRLSRSVALTMSVSLRVTPQRRPRLRTAVCAQLAHGVATVYDRNTGEIRGGGVPRFLATTVFTWRSMTPR